jgi:hypothetical protein
MMLDDAVTKAKDECTKFLATPHNTKSAEVEDLAPVMKAVNLVLAATSFSLGLARPKPCALRLQAYESQVGGVRVLAAVSLVQDGTLVKETMLTCAEGCHIFERQVEKITLEELVKSGTTANSIVSNIVMFLNDPKKALAQLNLGMNN